MKKQIMLVDSEEKGAQCVHVICFSSEQEQCFAEDKETSLISLIKLSVNVIVLVLLFLVFPLLDRAAVVWEVVAHCQYKSVEFFFYKLYFYSSSVLVPVLDYSSNHRIVIHVRLRLALALMQLSSHTHTHTIEDMESSSTSPTIEQSIQYLKDHLLLCIDQGVIAHSAVRVFVSSVHLLCAIKQEQHYIAYYGYVINIRGFKYLQ